MEPGYGLSQGIMFSQEAFADAAYAILTHNGTTVRVERHDWTVMGGKYVLYYDEIASTQMGDAVTADFYDADGNLLNVQGEISVNVRDQAISILESDAPEEKKRMYMDLLNYGAAAQAHFGYNSDNLVNAGLDAYQIYATQDVELADYREKGTGYSATTLEMESQFTLNLLFSKKTVDKSMRAVITITDAEGLYFKTYEINGSDFKSHTNNRWRIGITNLAPEDYDDLITCEIYSGDTLVSSVTDSVGSYLSRAINGGGGAVYEMALRYCQSVKKTLRVPIGGLVPVGMIQE